MLYYLDMWQHNTVLTMVGNNNNKDDSDNTEKQGTTLQRYTSKNAWCKGQGANNTVTMVESNKDLYINQQVGYGEMIRWFQKMMNISQEKLLHAINNNIWKNCSVTCEHV